MAGEFLLLMTNQGYCSRFGVFSNTATPGVLTSRSGEHAWGVVQRSQAKPDLVLTDIITPGSIDGPALARRIERKYKKLPVLFMTGALPENDEQAVEMTRKRRLLRKPFSPQQLVEFIDPHFRESKAGT